MFVDGLHEFLPPGATQPARFWLRRPPHDVAAPHPLLVFLHGLQGNHRLPWSQPELRTLRRVLLMAGFLCVSPDLGPNHWMNVRARRTLLALLEWLPTELPLASPRVHLLGFSMGGAGALTFAAHHPDRVASVCALMGVTDYARFYREGFYRAQLEEAFGGSPDERPEVYAAQSPLSHVDRLRALPILLIHGTADTKVPVWNARDFVAAMEIAGAPIRYREVPGVGHTNAIVQGLEEDIVRFLQESVPPSAHRA